MIDHPLAHQVVQLWQQQLDTFDIAQRLGVAESWVYHVLARWREEREAA